MGENALGSTLYKLGMENLASVARRFREVMHPARDVSVRASTYDCKALGRTALRESQQPKPKSLNPPY